MINGFNNNALIIGVLSLSEKHKTLSCFFSYTHSRNYDPITHRSSQNQTNPDFYRTEHRQKKNLPNSTLLTSICLQDVEDCNLLFGIRELLFVFINNIPRISSTGQTKYLGKNPCFLQVCSYFFNNPGINESMVAVGVETRPRTSALNSCS